MGPELLATWGHMVLHKQVHMGPKLKLQIQCTLQVRAYFTKKRVNLHLVDFHDNTFNRKTIRNSLALFGVQEQRLTINSCIFRGGGFKNN
jgi:hypothetical protein